MSLVWMIGFDGVIALCKPLLAFPLQNSNCHQYIQTVVDSSSDVLVNFLDISALKF